jgi:hypothetical protein
MIAPLDHAAALSLLDFITTNVSNPEADCRRYRSRRDAV